MELGEQGGRRGREREREGEREKIPKNGKKGFGAKPPLEPQATGQEVIVGIKGDLGRLKDGGSSGAKMGAIWRCSPGGEIVGNSLSNAVFWLLLI